METSQEHNSADFNRRLATSSDEELLAWHHELRQSIEHSTDAQERKAMRDQIIQIQHRFVEISRTRLDSDTENYKQIIKRIKEQIKK